MDLKPAEGVNLEAKVYFGFVPESRDILNMLECIVEVAVLKVWTVLKTV